MNIKRFTISTAAIALLTVAGIGLATQNANAADPIRKDGMVERFAQHFNINEDDMQAFMDEMHDEKQARHEQRLSEAVANGTITEAQKQTLEAKHEAMQEEREALKDLTPEERHSYMNDHRENMSEWAESEGVDFPALHSAMHYREGHGT